MVCFRIRCERATALLNQMVAASEDKKDEPKADEAATSGDPSFTCKPKGVFELRGGIERYVKTFPQGGFWRGKNYLFDRYVMTCIQAAMDTILFSHSLSIATIGAWSRFQKDGPWKM